MAYQFKTNTISRPTPGTSLPIHLCNRRTHPHKYRCEDASKNDNNYLRKGIRVFDGSVRLGFLFSYIFPVLSILLGQTVTASLSAICPRVLASPAMAEIASKGSLAAIFPLIWRFLMRRHLVENNKIHKINKRRLINRTAQNGNGFH